MSFHSNPSFFWDVFPDLIQTTPGSPGSRNYLQGAWWIARKTSAVRPEELGSLAASHPHHTSCGFGPPILVAGLGREMGPRKNSGKSRVGEILINTIIIWPDAISTKKRDTGWI